MRTGAADPRRDAFGAEGANVNFYGPTNVTTPPVEDIYWVISVTSPGGPEGVTQVDRRFEFRGECASIRAWTCYESAERHGMKVRVEKVRPRIELPTRLVSA